LQGASVSTSCLGELSSPSAEVNSAGPPLRFLGPGPKTPRPPSGGPQCRCSVSGSSAPPRPK
jgi:hypothetical protein